MGNKSTIIGTVIDGYFDILENKRGKISIIMSNMTFQNEPLFTLQTKEKSPSTDFKPVQHHLVLIHLSVGDSDRF